MHANRIILVTVALAAATAFIPSTNAFNVSDDCDDNTTTFGGTPLENTIFPAPGAFVGVGGSPVPGPIGAQHVGSQHVGPQSTPVGDTPTIDTPPVDTEPQQVDPILTPPRVQTNWAPDCVTIPSGTTLTFTNGDAEAVHAPELGLARGTGGGACWAAPAALVVPTVDTDKLTLSYNAATGNIDMRIVSERATAVANTDAPGGLLVSDTTFSCTPLQLALSTTGTGINKQIDKPGLAVDEESGVATLTYTCFIHHAAMTGTIKIEF